MPGDPLACPRCVDLGDDDDCPAVPDDLAPLWAAALPADAPGAWIRAAIERLAAGA